MAEPGFRGNDPLSARGACSPNLAAGDVGAAIIPSAGRNHGVTAGFQSVGPRIIYLLRTDSTLYGKWNYPRCTRARLVLSGLLFS